MGEELEVGFIEWPQESSLEIRSTVTVIDMGLMTLSLALTHAHTVPGVL